MLNYIIAYLIIINIVAAAATVLDKYKAVHHKWRISEAALLFISALGGGIAMYASMIIIRHKTRKPKFMLGIPIIVAVEFLLVRELINYVL